MANVTEAPVWEPGVYQIKTTDPVLGGPNGIANTQAVQLANRTAWLKLRADQVDAAGLGHGGLVARLSSVEASAQALGPEMQNASHAALKFALNQAALANYGVRALREQAQQQGEFTLSNRGVVEGCVVTKSVTAARNLHISGGRCFAQGRIFAVADGNNAASVPSNTGAGSVVVTAFLHQDSGGLWRMAVTPIGSAVPQGAIPIYSLAIPAGSTDATDPHLTHVPLTSLRRIEAAFPQILDSAAQITLPIKQLSGQDYQIQLDVIASAGAPCDAASLIVSSRAANGFTVRLASAADDVSVRYSVVKLNQ